jgi:hypothetical protein
MGRPFPIAVGSGACERGSEVWARELGWAGLREQARREAAAQEEKEIHFSLIF